MRLKPSLFVALLLVASGFPASAGDIIDRIVATVNRSIILQSDWEDAVRYEAFIGGRPLDHVTNEDRKAALDRLIDQELLREQVHLSDPVPSRTSRKSRSESAKSADNMPARRLNRAGWLCLPVTVLAKQD